MSKEIKDLDLVLAGKLAMMIGAAGDIEIRGPIMTVPMRELEGSLVSFDYDIRGLAARVEGLKSDAIIAMGNDRGGQHAALALVANGIMEEHPDWDFSVYTEDDEDDEDCAVEPLSIEITELPGFNPDGFIDDSSPPPWSKD